MRTKYLTTALFALCMALMLNTIDAQEKTVKVITNNNGDAKVKIFTSTDEIDEETKKLLEEKGIDLDNLEAIDEESYKIKIIDNNGEMQELNWDGEGEMPEGMRAIISDFEEGGKEKCCIKKKIILTEEDMGGIDDLDIFISEELEGLDQGGIQLGVIIEEVDNGVKVLDLVEDSDAKTAGIYEGDIIQYLNGAPVKDIMQLIELVNENEVGDVATLTVLRDGNKKNIDVKLTEKKSRVYVQKIECDWTDKAECKKKCAKECQKICTKEELAECKKKCSKEDYEKCKKAMEEAGTFTAPRNTLKLKDFNAYPNPSDGLVNIEFRSGKSPIIVQVVDMNGRDLFKDVVNNFDGYYKNQINIQGMVEGNVFISVVQNEKVYTKQVIVN